MTERNGWQRVRVRMSDENWKAYQTLALRKGISAGDLVADALAAVYGSEMELIHGSLFTEGVHQIGTKFVETKGKPK